MIVLSRRRALALAVGALLGTGSAQACGPGLRHPTCKVRFGTAVASGDLAQPAYAALVARECAVLVPTWEMKWGAVQKQPGRFTFAAADAIVAFARAHGMGLRGHTLIWHGNNPAWLAEHLTTRTWPEIMAGHMAAVLGRYRSAIDCWDVVNEAIEPEQGRADGLRDGIWLRAAGPAYVTEAYKLAARFAPTARLAYNDYGVEHDAPWTRRRRLATLQLLESLRKAGAPVHTLGLQSHLRVGDAFDAPALTRFLDEVRGLGLTPQITELDVRADRIASPMEKDRQTADLARAYLEVVLAAGCDTVLCWGLSDDKNWRAAEEPDDRPLPFDRDLAKKPLYEAIRQSLTQVS